MESKEMFVYNCACVCACARVCVCVCVDRGMFLVMSRIGL